MIKHNQIIKHISVIILFLSLSGCVSALEMAFEDRSGDDIGTDTQIKTEILAEIVDKQGASVAASTSVIVYEQVVLLSGALEKSSDRNAVNSIARNTESVKRVINELTPAKADSSTSDAASDILINQKIHAQAATNNFIRHTNWRWNTDGEEKFGSRELSPNIIRRIEEPCGVKVLGEGFPPEMVDDEPEEKGYEVVIKGRKDG